MANVFITGATGTPGRQVARLLASAGHRIAGAGATKDEAALIRADGGVPTYPDMQRVGEIRSAIQAYESTIVVHLAPQMINTVPQIMPKVDPEAIETSTASLIEAAHAAGIEYLLHTSYAWLSAPALANDSAAAPLRAAALRAEQAVLNSGIPAAVLRLGFLYGAESDALHDLRATLKGARPLSLVGERGKLNFVYVDDAVRAIIAAIDTRPTGSTLDIVDDHAIAPADFVRRFAAASGLGVSTLPGFIGRALGDGGIANALGRITSTASNLDAKSVLNWTPRYATVEQGIDDLMLTWRAQDGVK